MSRDRHPAGEPKHDACYFFRCLESACATTRHLTGDQSDLPARTRPAGLAWAAAIEARLEPAAISVAQDR